MPVALPSTATRYSQWHVRAAHRIAIQRHPQPACFGTSNFSTRYRATRASSAGRSALISTCQRQRFFIRSTGQGAGPMTVTPPARALARSARAATPPPASPAAPSPLPACRCSTTFASRTFGGYGGLRATRQLLARRTRDSRASPRTAPRDATGMRVWISTSPALRPAPGAARDLAQELEAPLATRGSRAG